MMVAEVVLAVVPDEWVLTRSYLFSVSCRPFDFANEILERCVDLGWMKDAEVVLAGDVTAVRAGKKKKKKKKKKKRVLALAIFSQSIQSYAAHL